MPEIHAVCLVTNGDVPCWLPSAHDLRALVAVLLWAAGICLLLALGRSEP